MPEGHTIHALAGRLDRSFGRRPVEASSPQGRFADEAARLHGEVMEGARAVGKHLFVAFPDEVLHVHLGLIGSFPVKPLLGQPPVEPRGALRLRLLNDDFVADLRGPITCELLGDEEVARVEAGLGPDPLDPFADGQRAWNRIRLRRKTIAELLMDQQVLAGVGNVYRCEVLHRHHISPFTLGTQLKPASWQLIWTDLVRLLPLGVAFSQILTVEAQVEKAESMVADGSASLITAASTGERVSGHFRRRYAVYKRTGQDCPRCGSVVREKVVAGRRLYWCGNCQRRH